MSLSSFFVIELMSKYCQPRSEMALVAQGGGQRGIFTAGVLDAFLAAGFDPFSRYVGVSAGALNLSSFIARQPGVGQRFIAEYTTQDRFFNLFQFIRRQQTMDLDWALSSALDTGEAELASCRAQLTLDEGREALACVTSTQSLKDHYFPMYGDQWKSVATATCAIPMLYDRPVEINAQTWVDGGVSAAIPALEAWRRGSSELVVIRTEKVVKISASASRAIETARQRIELELPEYLRRLKLDDELSSLKTFHKGLSNKLDSLSKEWRELPFVNDLEKNLELSSANKGQGDRWLFSGNHFFRLLALKRSGYSNEMLEMLISHYRNTQETERFLASPPSGVKVIQIAPTKPLLSTALLSSQHQLASDYQHGLDIGSAFVDTWRQQHGMRPLEHKKIYRHL